VAKTVIGPEMPVMKDVTESVAVIVWEPAVIKVTENVPVPLVRTLFGGKDALRSLLEN
jgi:hypothetical protein